jgi:large-conductance mechanosensitive channel
MIEQIVTATMGELREELNEKIDANIEPSRFMRLMHLKYKCFVIFILAFIAISLIVYITIKEVLRDEEMGVIMTTMFEHFKELHFPNVTLVNKSD